MIRIFSRNNSPFYKLQILLNNMIFTHNYGDPQGTKIKICTSWLATDPKEVSIEGNELN